MWDILQQTIHRVSTLVERCRIDLLEAKGRIDEPAEAGGEPKEEDALEAMEEALDRSFSQQKSMFLVIFQVSPQLNGNFSIELFETKFCSDL